MLLLLTLLLLLLHLARRRRRSFHWDDSVQFDNATIRFKRASRGDEVAGLWAKDTLIGQLNQLGIPFLF